MEILTIIILIAYIATLIRRKNVVRPNTLFTIVILSSMFVTGLRLSSRQSIYPVWFYLLIYLTIIAFNIGNSISLSYNRSNTDFLESEIRFNGMSNYNSGIMRIIIIILWLALMLSVVVTIAVLGPPPALSLTSDRNEYFLSGWGSIYALNTSLYALLLFDRYQKESLGKFWNYFFSYSIYLVVFLMANKFQIFSLIFVFFTARALLKKGQSLWKIFLLIFIGLIVFVLLYNYIYINMYDFTNEDSVYYYEVNIPHKYNYLANPYLYIATNFENLYHYFSSPHHLMYGYCELYNITRDFRLCNFIYTDRIGNFYTEYNESLHMGALNTGSMFLIPYRDFGVPGILIYSFICGSICGAIQRHVMKYKTFAAFFAYCYAIICVFMSFFTESFLSKNMLINLVAGLFISILVHEKIVFSFKGKTIKDC